MDFLDLNILDFLDVLLVSVLLFQLYQLVRSTVAIKICIGLATTYLFWKLVGALQMDLLSEILGQFIGVGVIAILIVFQQEIRKFLLVIGSTSFQNQQNYVKSMFYPHKKMPLNLNPLLSACASMSLSKTGALLIISRNTKLGSYESTGELMNARLSSSLIESVFFKNNPLHDGAVILNRNRIAAARCILPVSETVGLPLHMGLRHRSAATLTEMTDALAIVVSEETGNIAYLKQGRLSELKNIEELEGLLIRDLNKH